MSRSELHDWECDIEQLSGDNADKMLVIAQDIYNTAFVRGKNRMSSVTPQQRWIPVSERLPKVGSEVLVCYDFKGNRNVYIAHFFGDGEFHGYDDEYLTSEGRKYRKAVAWMPLPEPYKAESKTEQALAYAD